MSQQNKGEEQKNQPRNEQRSDQLEKNLTSRDQEKEDQPEGGKPDDQRGVQKPSNQRPPSKDPERVNHPDLSGRWGVLPPKIQDDILNFNIEKLPQKYRKWLEEYYKRINRTRNQ